MKTISLTEKRFISLLEFYDDLNYEVFLNKFNCYKYNAEYRSSKNDNEYKIPIFLNQMGILYSLSPLRFDGQVNNELLSFLGYNFRDRIIFLFSDSGFLLYIYIMDANEKDRININNFFAHNIDELNLYDAIARKFNSDLLRFKLVHLPKYQTKKNTEDIILTFSL